MSAKFYFDPKYKKTVELSLKSSVDPAQFQGAHLWLSSPCCSVLGIIFGRPRGRRPAGSRLRAVRTTVSSSVIITWPYHLSRA